MRPILPAAAFLALTMLWAASSPTRAAETPPDGLAGAAAALPGAAAAEEPGAPAAEQPAAPGSEGKEPATPEGQEPAAPEAVPKVLRGDLAGLLGRSVRDKAGDKLGQIVDILVNADGQATAAVIDFGGFLGVGSRKIAVDWHMLHFPEKMTDDSIVTLDIDREQLAAAPQYNEGKPAIVLQAPSGGLPQESEKPTTQ
jgi:hypothetical protein